MVGPGPRLETAGQWGPGMSSVWRWPSVIIRFDIKQDLSPTPTLLIVPKAQGVSRMSPACAKSQPPSFLSPHRAARAVTSAAQGTTEHRDVPPRSSPRRSEAAGSSVAAASHAWPLTFKSEVRCNETFSSLRAGATWRVVSGHVWLPTAALAGTQNIPGMTLRDTAWEQAVGSSPPCRPVLTAAMNWKASGSWRGLSVL